MDLTSRATDDNKNKSGIEANTYIDANSVVGLPIEWVTKINQAYKHVSCSVGLPHNELVHAAPLNLSVGSLNLLPLLRGK